MLETWLTKVNLHERNALLILKLCFIKLVLPKIPSFLLVLCLNILLKLNNIKANDINDIHHLDVVLF